MRIKITSANALNSNWYRGEIGSEYDVIDGKKTPNGWYWVKSTATIDYAVHENDCIVLDFDPNPIPKLNFWAN